MMCCADQVREVRVCLPEGGRACLVTHVARQRGAWLPASCKANFTSRPAASLCRQAARALHSLHRRQCKFLELMQGSGGRGLQGRCKDAESRRTYHAEHEQFPSLRVGKL